LYLYIFLVICDYVWYIQYIYIVFEGIFIQFFPRLPGIFSFNFSPVCQEYFHSIFPRLPGIFSFSFFPVCQVPTGWTPRTRPSSRRMSCCLLPAPSRPPPRSCHSSSLANRPRWVAEWLHHTKRAKASGIMVTSHKTGQGEWLNGYIALNGPRWVAEWLLRTKRAKVSGWMVTLH